jgi:hypothetical protein
MKKIFLLLILAIITATIANPVKAQKRAEAGVIKLTEVNLDNRLGNQTVEFYPTENVYKLQVQTDYTSMGWDGTGKDSVKFQIFVSANSTNFSSNIASYIFNWDTTDGTSKTYNGAIDVSGYPIRYIKVTADTTTGIRGYLNVYLKPYFNN